MAALWASRCGIDFRIFDKRPEQNFNGKADGLQCRSMEIFESFGFVQRVEDECVHSIEMCFWVRFLSRYFWTIVSRIS